MSCELALNGLDGANPLAFLAAVGTLRALSDRSTNSDYCMHWARADGSWRPVLSSRRSFMDSSKLVDMLHTRLASMRDHPAFMLADDLSVTPSSYRAYAISAAASATPASATHAEFASAFASESVVDDKSGKQPVVADTALRTMSGAGHQHFLGFMRELVATTTGDDIRRALFEEWRYQDGKPSLRWDPEDDRRYALRWKEPSGDPIRTVRGANRLAIEALPMFPVMPGLWSLETTGFVTKGSKGTYWTWPLWGFPLPLSIVRSTLSLSSLPSQDTDTVALGRRGIVARYRSQRLTTGKYRNFTTARAL